MTGKVKTLAMLFYERSRMAPEACEKVAGQESTDAEVHFDALLGSVLTQTALLYCELWLRLLAAAFPSAQSKCGCH